MKKDDIEALGVEAITSHICDLHPRREDFEEGDLLHRASKFTHYESISMPIDSIDLDEFSLDEDLVESYAEEFRKTGTYPRIIYDGVERSMIDGLHRVAALALCGEASVNAYVGTEKYLDEDLSENYDEDEDEDEDEEDCSYDEDAGFSY